jgi:xanthine dehydrogenase YagS FAD-binding subunit
LVAYGAKFRLVSSAGEREVAAADYFTRPTLQNVLKENVLEDEEILTHVILPPPGNVKTGHYEVRYKASHDWPLAFTTVVLAMNGSTIQSARVVLGAVAPIPWRSKPAEEALTGKPLNEMTAAAAGEAAVTEAAPMSGNAYKVQIAKTAVKRAVMNAAGIKTV